MNKPIPYAAFLRGIGPGDPKKSNESLKKVFVSLGFDNVRSFISSGNILFESTESNTKKLEEIIEKGLKAKLGIEIGTFVRSKRKLEAFVETSPFGKRKHSNKHYLIVTFYKEKPDAAVTAALKKERYVVGIDTKIGAVSSALDMSSTKTPDIMAHLEKLLGKEITTRTINTVERVIKRL